MNCGKERDAETGLDYFGARYFSAAQGRWTSPDPDTSWRLLNPQSWNKYAYVLNNPLGRLDPDGQKDKPFNASTDTPADWNAPGATRMPSPSAYNCHSYAWYGGKGWVNDPTRKVKSATPLADDEPNQPGDRVIYYVDKNGDGKWEPGEEIVHSAIVTTVDAEGNTTEVTGKQGQLGIGTNHPDAPGYYSTNDMTPSGTPTKREYFRPKPNKPLPKPPATPQPPAPSPATPTPQPPTPTAPTPTPTPPKPEQPQQ
jgi:RHS repeat-associated protein